MTALPRQMARSAALLGLVAVLGTALLAGVNTLTKDRIVEQQRRAVLVQLNQVLPANAYDNELHEDLVVINDPDHFRQRVPVRVYRARLRGAPVAAIFDLATPDGYNGDIRLLVAIRYDGHISGVRVVEHRETPGLGDPIERRRSDWITRFDGRSLDDPRAKGWAVKRDGGEFDQFTGATITPRAVVAAVQRALAYFTANRERIFTLEAMGESNEPRG